jgi:hypothetical protein
MRDDWLIRRARFHCSGIDTAKGGAGIPEIDGIELVIREYRR